jgi:hypothetical protein
MVGALCRYSIGNMLMCNMRMVKQKHVYFLYLYERQVELLFLLPFHQQSTAMQFLLYLERLNHFI